MKLLRRATGAPQADEEPVDLVQAEAKTGANGAPAAANGHAAAAPTTAPVDPSTKGTKASSRADRAAARSDRAHLVRQARKATSKMEPPEPRYGIYVALFMAAVALVSLFSTDAEQVSQKVGKATRTVWEVVPHDQVVPAASAVLALVAASALTIYWRKRMVTMVAFMITAALSISLPLPQSMADLRWGLYLVPLGYAMWVFWRQNKAQKALLATSAREARDEGATAGSGPRRSQAAHQATARAGRSRRKDQDAPISVTGRPLPPSSGRYTRPQPRRRAGQRKR